MGFNFWQNFENFEFDVRFKNRFVHSMDSAEFLRNIKRTLSAREILLAFGTTLYGGQIGYDEYEQDGEMVVTPYSSKRMKPICNKGTEGEQI